MDKQGPTDTTGDCIQYPVINRSGKEEEKEYIYIYMCIYIYICKTESSKGKGGNKSGSWDQYTHTPVHKIDNQQGPPI